MDPLARLRAALLFLALALITGCGDPGKPPQIAKQNPLWGKYISAHTAGLVSRQSKVRVVFATDVASSDLIGKPANDLLDIAPGIDGNASFTGPRELVLTPEKPLRPGAWYRITVKARHVLNLPKDLNDYQFAFQVIQQDFDVKLAGLNVDPADDSRMLLAGTVMTADVEDVDRVQKVVLAKLADNTLSVVWQHDTERKRHDFTVSGILRQKQAQAVKVAWDGEPIGVSKHGDQQVEVPARETFELTQVRAMQGPPQYVSVSFSDNLDPHQNLNGLVRTDQGAVRTRIEGSEIKIYPEKRFTGKVAVTLEEAIRNNRGVRIAQRIERTVAFAGEKPQVRFAGQGVILPDNPVLSIPFEAVNVRSVQVTAMRIYDNNVGQFLQTNKLDGAEALDRVGRFLWRKTIHLPTVDPDTWGRYSLDATQLLRENPGGLFRLTLSINRGNSTYGCTQEENAVPASKEEPLANSEDLNVKEASSWDYAEDFYGQNQDGSAWAERENPCKDSYYKHATGVRDSRNFIASNIGLIAKRDQRGKLWVVATNLQTAEPLKGVNLTVMNFQNQATGTAATDADGFAQLPAAGQASGGTPFYVLAEHGSQKGYLKVNGGNALPTSHFDVGGEKVEAGLKGFVYGERGVWRPGDDIYLTFVLQDKDGTLPPEHPVSMSLYNPQGQLVQTVTNTKPVGGFYAFTLKTPDDAPTGNWTAKAQLGGSVFTKTVKIETVMPNRLKVELDFGKETLSAADMPVKGKVFGEWLHGATASGLKTDVSVRMQSVATRFDRYADYVFDDPVRNLKPDEQKVFEGTLDSKGYATFEEELLPGGEAPGLLAAQFTTRVFEEGGAFSSAQTSVPFYPYRHFVGIKLPKGDQSRGMLLTDKKHPISVATLDAQGKPASLKRVQVKIYKVEWKWWWDKTADSLAQFADSEHTHAVVEGEIATKNGQGTYEFEIKYPEWGRFLVRACDADGGHCTGQIFYIDWPGWAGRAREEGGAGANALTFVSDKQDYNVGETATVTLPEATQGRALVTVETGTTLIEQRWVEFAKGKTTFQLPITAAMSPNVYVAVTLIQPHQGKNNDRPIRMYGIIPLKVQDPGTQLKPLIKAADEWRPETSVNVEVSEAGGREMSYTLAVVDEGLLGLTGFKTPNLHSQFYRKEALGVATWDLFDLVAGAYGGDLERLLALGGDESGEAKQNMENKKRFPPVVRFMGPFKLKAKSVNKHDIALPQYVGAVRVMVVAGERGAYGSADKTVPVRQPLSLLATLPRVLGPGEELAVPVSLFVMDATIKDVTLKIEPDKHFSVVGEDSAQVRFDKPGDRLATLRLKVLPALGKGTVKFTANSGQHVSRAEIAVDVRSPNPATTNVLSKMIKPGETWEEQVLPHGIPGTNSVTLEVSSLRPLNLEKHLDYLVRYPHGCVEQTTSSVFPQLYLNALVRLDDPQKGEIERNVRAGIERLRLFQAPQGGFVYWPGGFTGGPQWDGYNAWANNYAGHFLVEAERLGYPVPAQMMTDWVNSQKALAQAWSKRTPDSTLEQAYRLYTLALVNQPELGAMNRLRESKELNGVARFQLAAAYKLAGHADTAEQLVRGADYDAPDYADPGFTFGSRLRDRAMILNSLIVLGDLDHAGTVAQAVSDELASERWYSTQSLAWSLAAMAKLGAAGKDGSVFTFEHSVGKNALKSVRADKPIHSMKLVGFPDAGETVRLRNSSDKPLFAFVVVKGAAKVGEEQAAAAGLSIDVAYHDTKGNAVSIDQLAQGSDFIAEVTITNTSERKLDNIALSHIVPSGWEIHNARLHAETDKEPAGIDYQDIRDDRVYSYFALPAKQSKSVSIRLNAAYLGTYYLPGISAEAMYDATKHARSKGQWVKVVKVK